MESSDMAVIFLIAALVLSAAEILAPGLVLLPFGLGAGVAAVAGFLGASPLVQTLIFLVASAGFFFALRPIGRRLNESNSDKGVGVHRMEGARAVVLEAIGPRDSGMVRVGREEWRADSLNDVAFGVGANVTVVEVKGTRVLVRAGDPIDPDSRQPPIPPPTNEPPQTPPLGGNPP